MMSPHLPDENTLAAMALALKTLPASTERAWDRVWAEVRAAPQRPAMRWPLALGLSMVTAFLTLSHLGLIGTLARPTLTAELVPVPHVLVETPAPFATTTPIQATSAPAHVATPPPIPLPPGRGG